MPNGHGGVPYFGGPIFFAMLFVIFTWLPFGDEGWFPWVRVGVCMIFATAIGWRIAYYVPMYNADDYGGAYTPPDVYRRMRRRYWIAVPFYPLVTAAVGSCVLWWRGLPASLQ